MRTVKVFGMALLCLALLLASACRCRIGASPKDGLASDNTPPSLPAALVRTTPDNDNTPTFTWEPATDDESGVAGYLVRIGNGEWIDVGNVTTYTSRDTVSDGSHTFEVKAVDKSRNEGAAAALSFICDTTPPAILALSVLVIWPSSATVTWTTDEPAVSQVQYGTTASYGWSQPAWPSSQSTYLMSHSIGVTDLTAGTTYHYRVRSADAVGNIATSNDYVFFVPSAPDAVPPAISDVGSSNVFSSSATITWTTDEMATSQVEYGTTSIYGSSSVLDGSLVTAHIVDLGDLTAGTTYHYRVRSRDASGNEATSGDKTFTTPQPPAPAIEILSHSSHVSNIGSYWVFGELRNNSSNNVRSVRIAAIFYDSANVVVSSALAYAAIDILVPSQKSPFLILESDPAVAARIDHYSLTVSDFDITSEEPYRSLVVLGSSSSVDGSGYYHVVGEVKNTGDQTATSVQVVATYYDSAGKVVAVDGSYTDPRTLAAGQTASFDVRLFSKTVVAGISSYELQVQVPA